MSTDFERDLEASGSDLNAARDQLLALVGRLEDPDLSRGRRGHWDIAGVLEHVIQSDWYYVRLIHQLRELSFAPPDVPPARPDSVAAAVAALAGSRDAILAAAGGVDEETFYRLGGPGHQQYSVLSVLENVTLHDHEHAAQIEQILATPMPASAAGED